MFDFLVEGLLAAGLRVGRLGGWAVGCGDCDGDSADIGRINLAVIGPEGEGVRPR